MEPLARLPSAANKSFLELSMDDLAPYVNAPAKADEGIAGAGDGCNDIDPPPEPGGRGSLTTTYHAWISADRTCDRRAPAPAAPQPAPRLTAARLAAHQLGAGPEGPGTLRAAHAMAHRSASGAAEDPDASAGAPGAAPGTRRPSHGHTVRPAQPGSGPPTQRRGAASPAQGARHPGRRDSGALLLGPDWPGPAAPPSAGGARDIPAAGRAVRRSSLVHRSALDPDSGRVRVQSIRFKNRFADIAGRAEWEAPPPVDWAARARAQRDRAPAPAPAPGSRRA